MSTGALKRIFVEGGWEFLLVIDETVKYRPSITHLYLPSLYVQHYQVYIEYPQLDNGHTVVSIFSNCYLYIPKVCFIVRSFALTRLESSKRMDFLTEIATMYLKYKMKITF